MTGSQTKETAMHQQTLQRVTVVHECERCYHLFTIAIEAAGPIPLVVDFYDASPKQPVCPRCGLRVSRVNNGQSYTRWAGAVYAAVRSGEPTSEACPDCGTALVRDYRWADGTPYLRCPKTGCGHERQLQWSEQEWPAECAWVNN
jgi:hypothetical protein